jgi:hypothetical protein
MKRFLTNAFWCGVFFAAGIVVGWNMMYFRLLAG